MFLFFAFTIVFLAFPPKECLISDNLDTQGPYPPKVGWTKIYAFFKIILFLKELTYVTHL